MGCGASIEHNGGKGRPAEERRRLAWCRCPRPRPVRRYRGTWAYRLCEKPIRAAPE
ncbi:MAG: hypothetical protein AMXMBFR53_41960 [Gemmatimonadota bacterium]